jgi:antirestriction protein ArdC
VRPRPSNVEPGEWGAKIVFYRQVRTTVRDVATGEEENESYLVLKSWTVFNVEQVEGEIVSKYRAALPTGPIEPDFGPAEQLLSACGATIRSGGDKAFYIRPIPETAWPNHRDGDYVVLPPRQQFNSLGAFYETAFHELAHWSEVRLDWNNKEQGYALGELVAEIASCYLAQERGVPQGESLENHASYLKSWIKEMKDDARYIVQASSQASKVADFLTSFVRPAIVADEAA